MRLEIIKLKGKHRQNILWHKSQQVSLWSTSWSNGNKNKTNAAKSLQLCPTLCDSVRPQRRQPTRLPRPWDSPGKNTGVGCHFLLQCMKVKSESEVVQSCLTLHDPVDCGPPGSSIHGIFQARVLEWGASIVLAKFITNCVTSNKILDPCGSFFIYMMRITIPNFQGLYDN